MHLHNHETPLEVRRVFINYNFESDIFNWWKSAVLYGVTSLLVLTYLIQGKNFYQMKKEFKYSIISYGFIVFLSAVFSNAFDVAWFGMPNYLEGALTTICYIVLFFAAYEVFNVKLLNTGLSIVTSIILAVCCSQFFRYDTFELPIIKNIILGEHAADMGIRSYAWPLYATLMSSNFLGSFAALVYPIFINKRNWLMMVASILIAVGSQSRGAFLSMGIATLYIFAIQQRNWKGLIPIIIFGISIFLMKFNMSGKSHNFSLGSSGRTWVWSETFKIIEAKDLFLGKGPGVFALEFPQADTPAKLANGWPVKTVVDRPHNFYLQTLYGSGFFALGSVLFLFAAFLMKHRNNLCSASVISYLVNVFFTDSSTSIAPLFWIIFGVGVGLIHENEKSRTRTKFGPRK